MKILLEKTEYEEVEVEFPFYSYLREDGIETYIKVDEKEFKRIVITEYGKMELFKCKSHNLAEIWYDNPSDERTWNDALLSIKKYLSEF